MPTSKENIQYFLEQMADAGHMRARPMFGEYGLYCNEKIVGLVCDDNIFVKITPISDKYLDSSHNAPPYPGAKNYLLIPEEKWEDREWLSNFIRDTADNVPLPLSRSPKARPTGGVKPKKKK